MEAWLKRAIAERDELAERVRKLGVFIESDEFQQLSLDDRLDLNNQYYHMRKYQNSLLRRIYRHSSA